MGLCASKRTGGESGWEQYAATPLKEALANVTLVDARWLASLAESEDSRLPRAQDVPAAARVSLVHTKRWGDQGVRSVEDLEERQQSVGVLVISCPWADVSHPDPRGEQLRRIAFVLRAFAERAERYAPGCKVGVFWDYCSLPQGERTPEERERFGRALESVGVWFSCALTKVLLVDKPWPPGSTYHDAPPYEGRGWCIVEQRLSGFSKHATGLISLSDLTGRERSLEEILKRDRRLSRLPPLAPDDLFSSLEAGVADGSVHFAEPADLPLVASIYKRAFLDEIAGATSLVYTALQWGDREASALARALRFGPAHGAAPVKLAMLALDNNRIGDAGAVALAQASGEGGALAKLKVLGLHYNEVGDEGAAALAASCAAGNLPALRTLDLGQNCVGDAGVVAIADALRANPSVTLNCLNLVANRVGDAGVGALIDACRGGHLDHVRDLFLGRNDGVSIAAGDAMLSAMKGRRGHVHF